jgi:hypothetical protein
MGESFDPESLSVKTTVCGKKYIPARKWTVTGPLPLLFATARWAATKVANGRAFVPEFVSLPCGLTQKSAACATKQTIGNSKSRDV